MATIGYIRVSTDAQNLARQKTLMREIHAHKVFAEKLSGKNTDRPQLKAMLEYVREGDTLHVESISRLARSTRDLLKLVDALQQKKVEFVSHKENIDTTTPQGRFTLTIFAALAELERETSLQRQAEGIAAARAAGKHLGRPRIPLPPNWLHIVTLWEAGKLTAKEAAQRAGLTRGTFYENLKSSREG